MAEWKKVVVSGSAISQFDNDAGYLTTGTLGNFVSGSSEAARTSLNSLTSGELSQLENIGTETISATQWAYLGAADQYLGTTNNVTFTNLDLDGDLAINTNKFTVDSATGNTVVAGTLNVTGGITGSLKGNVDGNAGTATKLANARSFTTTGDVVLASANFDGSANFTTTATIQTGAVENTMFAANAKTAISGANTAVSAALASDIADIVAAGYDLDVSDGSNTGVIVNSETLTIQGTANEVEVAYADGSSTFTIGLPSTITAGLTGNVTGNVTGNLTGTASFATKAATLHTGATGVDLTLTGDLTVQGTTTTIDTTNLNVTDQFINLNDGGSAADGGIVVEGQGTSFGWANSAGRWAFDFEGATEGQTTIAADAYVAAVVTSDDSNYQKNGNIRVQGGEIYIYVE